jgi:hypothetical protein
MANDESDLGGVSVTPSSGSVAVSTGVQVSGRSVSTSTAFVLDPALVQAAIDEIAALTPEQIRTFIALAKGAPRERSSSGGRSATVTSSWPASDSPMSGDTPFEAHFGMDADAVYQSAPALVRLVDAVPPWAKKFFLMVLADLAVDVAKDGLIAFIRLLATMYAAGHLAGAHPAASQPDLHVPTTTIQQHVPPGDQPPPLGPFALRNKT